MPKPLYVPLYPLAYLPCHPMLALQMLHQRLGTYCLFAFHATQHPGPFRPVQSRRPELAKFGKSSEGGKLNPTPPTTKISMGIDESQQIRTFSFTTTLCNLLNSNNLNISIDLV